MRYWTVVFIEDVRICYGVDERFAQRNSIELLDPLALQRLIPLIVPDTGDLPVERAVPVLARDLHVGYIERLGDGREIIQNRGYLHHVSNVHARLILAQSHLQAEGVKIDAALHGHVHVNQRRNTVRRRRIIFAPRVADFDDFQGPVTCLFDGHIRGPIVVTRGLRDEGMEVIYGGMLTPKEIIIAAMEEDVDVIGLHIGGKLGTVRRIMDMIQEKKLDDVIVVAGGPVPPEDVPLLKEWGIKGVFPPGSTIDGIVKCIKDNLKR